MKQKDRDKKKKKRDYEIDDDSDSVSDGDPQSVVQDLLKEFPNIGSDLKQLLQLIDDGKAVDINGIANKSLIKPLRALFLSLHLKELDHGAFVLPSHVPPTLEVIGSLIRPSLGADADDGPPRPERRPIGPEMPTPELLAAAAKLKEAEAELREAELEEKRNRVFIGPAPRVGTAEGESVNQGDRFEEATRIMEAEDGSMYDILGVDHNASADYIKKRYWKLSLLVHPDKCSHPQASQAFVKLNKAFKELQDPEKRRALDEKIELKEKQERFKGELRAMREAAMWRKMQGIYKEGDEELLAGDVRGVKSTRKRDEWMTELPPERKHGTSTMQSTMFSRSAKQGRGDTSGWADAPSERARKAKMDYLQAYNEFASLASKEEERKRSLDAELMDRYNKEKRSKSLLQKHKEEIRASRLKRKYSKQQVEEEDWVGKHPWKPWDREKDLAGGRQSVKLEDTENLTRGLSSRFSGGSYQRNFL